jgi:hypothetical protein
MDVARRVLPRANRSLHTGRVAENPTHACLAGHPVPEGVVTCPTCGVIVLGGGRYEIRGHVDDVVAVLQETQRQRSADRGPWRTGLFYLLCLAFVAAVLLAVVRIVPLWIVPLVLATTLSGVAIVGALQQRHDGKISERGMRGLIKAALRTARPASGTTTAADS